ncbi:hypothetical protein AFB00_10315 [Pseudonocardia sp. HH130630-07]|nr:hypothetical protein AFB00_10315 [Pseudonocardia sp. HH130630-07]
MAELLGYDKTYISMLETRRRSITDVRTLRRIAHTLGVPVHALGATEADDATFEAMIQFAGWVITLAEIARKSGDAAHAVDELWPLVARLESRASEGSLERESLIILVRARLRLGVTLGTLLPEENLAHAAKWTGRALLAATHLDDAELTTRVLAMHGNELRKAGRTAASISRLQLAVSRASDTTIAAAASAMLARAYGEAGREDLFDGAMRSYRSHLDRAPESGMLATEFTYREIHLRGLADTGRTAEAHRLMQRSNAAVAPPAPQWAAIERITAGRVLLATGEREEAEAALIVGLRLAESARLPHQVQRAVRVAISGGLHSVTETGRTLLLRLTDSAWSRLYADS